MPSLTPLGEKIRGFRASLGLTQLELALVAGLSERTLRSAEKSQPVRQSYLEAIAGALGVTLPDIAEASQTLHEHQLLQRNIATFVESIGRAMSEHDPYVALMAADPGVTLNYAGCVPGVRTVQTLMGQYRGVDGVKQFVDNVASFWAQDPGDAFALDAPTGKGNLLVLRGWHQLKQQEGDGLVWGRFTYIAEFEQGKLINLDGMMVPGEPPLHTVQQLGGQARFADS